MRAIAVMTLVPFAVGSCGSCGSRSDGPAAGAPAAGKPLGAYVLPDDAPDGLDLRVSDGQQGAPAFDRAKLAPAKPLAAAEVAALLARAKPIATDPADFQAFALRPNSQPPPRTGNTVKETFPPSPSSLLPPAANDAGKELTVLRYMPEGEVPLAPELSVTFSQPMLAVTSQDDASKVRPVKLTPEPKGAWRWIGTRTILFDPDVRFPQATTYTVEIPAGTKSALGNALKAPTKFTFETPPPSIAQSYPPAHEPQHLGVPMFLRFDQQIDPQAVLARLKVTAGSHPVAVQLLGERDIAAATTKAGKELAAMIAATKQSLGAVGKAPAVDGRWLAFRATSKLPADSTITVTVDAGTPSAEGPNKTKAAQSFSFRTYPPLAIERAECGYRDRCPPSQPFVIDFNNPLETDKWKDGSIAVSPPIPGLKILQQGDHVVVAGRTKSRVTYKVTVKAGITDEFGQQLARESIHTFTVGDAVPTFYGPSGMVVLDPAAKAPTLDFFSTNYESLKVRLHKVTPADFDAYNHYLRNRWNRDRPPPLPGTGVVDRLVATKVAQNELVESSIDLAPALAQGKGHAIAVVTPHPWPHPYEPPTMVSWVQATKLGIDAYVDSDTLIAFASELDTGKPAAGVALEVRPFGLTATTDATGMARIALGTSTQRGAHYLVATRGDDVAFVTDHAGYYSDSGTWVKQGRPQTLMWYVLDDRKMYKPGEEVSLKGWLRLYDQGKAGDIRGVGDAVTALTYVVRDSRGNEIGKGTAPVSAVGTFDTKLTLPKTPNLGTASVTFTASGGQHHHAFEIQEFRRPEFEVSAKASDGPFLVAGGGDVTVTAKYYTGGPLPGAPVAWNVTASQTTFTPPNRDDFTFGEWVPWWGYSHRFYDDPHRLGGTPPKTWSLQSKTDASGAHTLHLDFLTVKPAMPMAVQATAAVSDVNRQTWVASAPLIVHPSEHYVGLRTKRPFVQRGQPFELDVIGVDLDGKAVPGAKIDVQAVRLDWQYKQGKYVQQELDPQACKVTVAKDPAPCAFATKEGGTYQVTATITDARNRPNTTKLTFWVAGGKQVAAREVEQEQVQIIPDKREYSAGNTAELLVQAPFFPAEGIVSWRRSGIVKAERITLTGPTTILQVPITDALVPNLHVQVDLVGMSARLDDQGDPDPKLPKRPAYASGQINLPVPPKLRTLAVTIAPSTPKLGPGESAKLAVTVVDAAGKPAADAEVAVIVVDEAILALTGYQFGSPLERFYAPRSPDARDHYSRSYVTLAKPEPDALATGMTTTASTGAGSSANSAPMADMAPMEESAAAPPPSQAPGKAKKLEARARDKQDAAGASAPADSIAIRSNFDPLAAWAPAVRTDANGQATVAVKVPDNLTRYRIIAIASAGERNFGKGESAITARLPLMVRPSPPRFLNFGDTFQLPVVVQNQTDAPMTVKLAARATNAKLTDGAGREVTVPANDRVEVRFPAAAELAGTARFQLVGSAGSASDAAEVALPVWTPATTEAFATYGVIDSGATKQPVALPGAVVQTFGGLEVTTASTNLQSLTDAVLYLVRYPYECAEQRASRILAIAALRDVLTAFKTKDMPSVQAMSASVDADLERLSQMQNYDGGFAFWERGRPSEPYLTVHVASALARAKAKGYAVPEAMLARAKPYLANIESHYPPSYGPSIRQAISAYALYTRKVMGDVDIAKAKTILAQGGGPTKSPMEVNGWLLGTMAGSPAAAAERAAIVRHALSSVSETAGAANFTTAYGDGAHVLLASDRRVDSVMLESLIQEQPALDLIPKLVTGLLAHRKRGRWLNTQENAFALLAMDRYFQTYEKTTPDFVARVWIGNDYAGDHAFQGRTTDFHAITIAMKDVAAHDKQDLTIQKDGKGRLYYRVGMTYAPASLRLEAADHGFVVERTYEGVDDPQDVVRQADGAWKIKAGARVRVRLTMVNENRRYHVALVDPLPAGLEAMNPALAVTGPIPTAPDTVSAPAAGGHGRYAWWYGPWYEHQNLRDERTEAFASLLWEGVHEYAYVARATTPGNFVVPPTKAEEMYMPETFGRGASDRVIVE